MKSNRIYCKRIEHRWHREETYRREQESGAGGGW
jgi:hypothetical protein